MSQSLLGMVHSESPQEVKLSFENLHFVLLFKLILYLRQTIEKLNQKNFKEANAYQNIMQLSKMLHGQ